jgi:large repetitive protein
MKTIFKFVFLLLFISLTRETLASVDCLYKVEYSSTENLNEKPLKVNNAAFSANTPPTASFTFLDKQCSSNHVQFTASKAAPTASYTYFWDFGDTFSSTVQNPTHKFAVTNGLSSQTFIVTLTITDAITLVSTKAVNSVTVVAAPDPTLNGTGSGTLFDGMPAFQINTNSSQVFTFTNGSTTVGTNTKYTINWGDGSPNFTSTTWTTTNHTYPIGAWTALYTIEGASGCTTVQPFVVFIGLKPTVILGEPAKIDPCDPGLVVFPISGTRNNPLGTTYTVSFNDGSPDTILNHPPPPAIAHSFKKSSCGVTSKGIMNSFYANIVAANPSGTSESFVVPLYISTPLTATCTLSSPITCTNTLVRVKNTSKGGVVVTAAGCEQPKSFWTISPSAGVTLASGIMGNNNGSTDPDFWTTGSDEISPEFSLPGKYTITYNIGNSCGVFKVDNEVCVEEPLVPDFSLDKNTGCIPTTVNATSTTNLINSCTVPIYKWNVSYTDGYCGTLSSYKMKNDSTPNASFEFKSAGIYHVKLSVTNSCGLRSATKDVIISMPPTVDVDTIPDFCGTASIRPKSVVNSCAPATATVNYFWEFPGGSPATSNIEYPGPINYALPGTYDVKLYVTTTCGASALSTRRFTIHEIPTLTNMVLSQTVCSNVPTTAVTLTADKPAATFNWTATATSGITGYVPFGTGNAIPVQTIITTNPFPGKVTYTITPFLGTCPGTPVDYVINVIPQPVLSSQPMGDDVCLNGTPNPLTVGYAGTVDFYQWYANTSNSTVGGTALSGFGANTATYNPPSATLGTTFYYCVLTIPGACTTITSKTAKVTVAAIPAITTQPIQTQTICVGGTIPIPLSVIYTGGTGIVTYQWYSSATKTNIGGTLIPFGGTNPTFTPVSTAPIGTTYYYVVVSFTGSNCAAITSDPAEVIVVADPTVTDPAPATQTICQYETPTTLSITASGGIGSLYNYQWYSNTVTNNSGGTLIPGATGHTYVPVTTSPGILYYYCEVKQPGGCDATSNYAEVEVVAAPTFPALASRFYCAGSPATPLVVNVTGGVGTPSYQWYSNTTNSIIGGTQVVGETTDTFTPPSAVASAVYYYCEITFPAGTCTKIYTNVARITVNDYPVISNKSAPICSGDPFLVTPVDALPDVVPVGTTYTWTVSTSVGSVTGAANQPTPVGSISQKLTNNNTTTSTVVYRVTPTAPGGCPGTPFDVTVTVHPAIVITSTVTNRTCFGINDASIVVSISGGNPFAGPTYDIKWTSTTGFTAINTNTIAGLAPGDYTIEVTDANNCKQPGTYTVSEPADMKITTDVKKDVGCFGANDAEIKITVTGGTTPYQYFWTKNGSTISGNTNSQKYIGPGNYEVTVMDANSCANNSKMTFLITEPPKLIVTAKVTQNLDCVSANSGAIDLTVSGGLAPYKYAWSSGQTTEDLTNIPSGSYTITVTDANGCPFIDTYVIVKPQPINISMNVTNEFDCATKTAFKRSEATVTGGFPPYTMDWSGGTVSGVNHEIMTTTASGSYILHVVDSLGCEKDEPYTITVEKPGIVATIVDCRRGLWQFNAQNANVAGDTYNYAWDFGDGSATSNLRNPQHTYGVFGKFTVKLTIVSSTCTSDYTKDVEVEPLPVLKFINYRICEGDSVTQTVIGNFKKKWSDGSTGDEMVIKQKGDYSVICMSPNGCLDTLNFSVLTDLYNYTIMTDREEVALDGKPLILWSESVPFSQYSWEFGDGTVGSGNKVSHEYTVVNNGGFDVTLTVINPYGCKEIAHKRVWIVNNKDANTFTPNGDGINDVFMPGWHLKIYNRNGILLFEGSSGWDGKYQGQLVSKDTYYYVMDYLTESGAKYKDGYVMVIR